MCQFWNLIEAQLVSRTTLELALTHVVGSSKNSTAGLSISSRAMDRRFFWPPLRLEHFVCRVFVSFSEFSR